MYDVYHRVFATFSAYRLVLMLNSLDDFPVHQTPEPLAHPATSDRNFYDRTWFNAFIGQQWEKLTLRRR